MGSFNMLLLTKTHPIEFNATLHELYLLSLWAKNPKHTTSASGTNINVLSNGSDCVDYYRCSIEFDEDCWESDTQNFLDWVQSLNQESNFGGVRENEFWITEENV